MEKSCHPIEKSKRDLFLFESREKESSLCTIGDDEIIYNVNNN